MELQTRTPCTAAKATPVVVFENLAALRRAAKAAARQATTAVLLVVVAVTTMTHLLQTKATASGAVVAVTLPQKHSKAPARLSDHRTTEATKNYHYHHRLLSVLLHVPPPGRASQLLPKMGTSWAGPSRE